jgi:polar amino acid transport system substrate-binding protein
MRKFMKKYLIVILISEIFFISYIHAIELKTAYQNSYQKYFKEQGEINGLMIDILNEIEKRAPDIEFKSINGNEFTPFARIKIELAKGRIDVFAGMSKTKEREKIYNYLKIPIYQVSFVLTTRSNNKVKIDSWEDVAKMGEEGRVLGIRGTGAMKILEQQTRGISGIKIDYGANSVIQCLEKIRVGRGDFFFYNDLETLSTIKKEGLTGQFVLLPKKFKEGAHYIGFSKKVPPEVITKLDKIFSDMRKEGILAKLYNSYVK